MTAASPPDSQRQIAYEPGTRSSVRLRLRGSRWCRCRQGWRVLSGRSSRLQPAPADPRASPRPSRRLMIAPAAVELEMYLNGRSMNVLLCRYDQGSYVGQAASCQRDAAKGYGRPPAIGRRRPRPGGRGPIADLPSTRTHPDTERALGVAKAAKKYRNAPRESGQARSPDARRGLLADSVSSSTPFRTTSSASTAACRIRRENALESALARPQQKVELRG